jgi:hypothetical protein
MQADDDGDLFQRVRADDQVSCLTLALLVLI